MRDGFHWTNCPVSPFLFPSPSRPLPFAVSLSPVPSPSLYRPLPPLHLPLPPLHLALAICVSPSVSFPRPPSFLSISLCVNSVIYANSQRPFNTLLWSTLPLFSLPPPPISGIRRMDIFSRGEDYSRSCFISSPFPSTSGSLSLLADIGCDQLYC